MTLHSTCSPGEGGQSSSIGGGGGGVLIDGLGPDDRPDERQGEGYGAGGGGYNTGSPGAVVLDFLPDENK